MYVLKIFQEILVSQLINKIMKKLILSILFSICFSDIFQYSGTIGNCYGLDNLNSLRNQFSMNNISDNENAGILFIYKNIDSGNSISGDVNGDEIVNVLDIVVTINLILSGNEYLQSADQNSDGIVNVLDIVTLVNLILSD